MGLFRQASRGSEERWASSGRLGRSGRRKEINPLSRECKFPPPKRQAPGTQGWERERDCQPALLGQTVTHNRRNRNMGQEACSEPCHMALAVIKTRNGRGGKECVPLCPSVLPLGLTRKKIKLNSHRHLLKKLNSHPPLQPNSPWTKC